jgi:elongation of very long chain fatty acids protein 4
MCGPTSISTSRIPTPASKAPVDVVLEPPSLLSRYTCATIMIAIFGIWGKIAFYGHSENGVYDESKAPGVGAEIHSWKVPLTLTASYLLGLPVLRIFTKKVLSPSVDVKLLLKETMVVYNGGQVLLNGWMVYRFLDALINKGHPFIGDIFTVNTGATFGVWIHYMDKYLEFFDTIFMVLRGRMDQVSFLHIYHHVSIAWAWWFAIRCYPGGDAYFGALLNSWIHVMMYSYYTLSLLKFPCPWKRYITQAQLLQFTSVVVYTAISFGIVKNSGEAEAKHYACFAVQTFEMVSLFYLFSLFYSKAYKKKKAELRRISSELEVPEQSSISSESSDDAVSNSSSEEQKKER